MSSEKITTELYIRPAASCELRHVREFYDNLIDHIDEFEYGPKWQKGVYPAYNYLEQSINSGNLLIGIINGSIVSAMILNSAGNASYKDAKWLNPLKDGEYSVIHALGVAPSMTGLGIGRRMVGYALNVSAGSFRAVRLDVLKGNIAANRLYESVGFVMTDTTRMFYEDTGWTDFELYKYPLP